MNDFPRYLLKHKIKSQLFYELNVLKLYSGTFIRQEMFYFSVMEIIAFSHFNRTELNIMEPHSIPPFNISENKTTQKPGKKHTHTQMQEKNRKKNEAEKRNKNRFGDGIEKVPSNFPNNLTLHYLFCGRTFSCVPCGKVIALWSVSIICFTILP